MVDALSTERMREFRQDINDLPVNPKDRMLKNSDLELCWQDAQDENKPKAASRVFALQKIWAAAAPETDYTMTLSSEKRRQLFLNLEILLRWWCTQAGMDVAEIMEGLLYHELVTDDDQEEWQA